MIILPTHLPQLKLNALTQAAQQCPCAGWQLILTKWWWVQGELKADVFLSMYLPICSLLFIITFNKHKRFFKDTAQLTELWHSGKWSSNRSCTPIVHFIQIDWSLFPFDSLWPQKKSLSVESFDIPTSHDSHPSLVLFPTSDDKAYNTVVVLCAVSGCH